MKRESKLTNVPHGGIISSWLLALLLIGVTLGANRAQAQPFAYVANNSSNNVSVIDTATNTRVDTDGVNPGVQDISVGSSPFGVAITPDGKHAYVTNAFSDTVSVIDTSNNTVIATVTLPPLPGPPPDFFCNCPFGIAITPDGSRAYVANQSSSSVSVIDTNPANLATFNTVIATVPLPVVPLVSFPIGLAITPDGKSAYVANGSSDMVSVIDTNPASLTFNTVVANVTLPLVSFPFWVAITPDGSRAYVTNLFSDTVSVITTSNNRVAATVNLPVGSFPFGMIAITPDGTRAYVANTALGTVSVIDTLPSSPGFNTVVDTNPATPDIIDDIPVGNAPFGVAITPDGSRAYVTNSGDFPGTVSVIDTTNNSIVGTPIPVGSSPLGLAITPPSTIVPFSALKAKVEIENHEIELKATFTLGTGNNGINPLTEDVSFQVGTFSTIIPAGSFKFHPAKSAKGKGKAKGTPAQWTFEGVIDGVKIEAKITDLGGGSFEFKAEAEGANLNGTVNPVQVKIIIGNDGGSTTVRAEFENEEDNHHR